jgi:nitrogen fixation/metabolism regulation signal transduction histidine kinase
VSLAGCGWVLKSVSDLFKRNARKVAFMFDAIENADHAFRYAEEGCSSSDRMVNISLNRIIRILFRAQADVVQKEKYYELILDSVNTGIIVVDDSGYIYQSNNEALRRLGSDMEELFTYIHTGHHQVSLVNERGTVHLSVRVSEMTLRDKHVRILVINDINNELENKEIDSWIPLTCVLTHEIMNAVTPITSLSDTLLSTCGEAHSGLLDDWEAIATTGNDLISFVESYRKFTQISTPRPTLFYLRKSAEECHAGHWPRSGRRSDRAKGLLRRRRNRCC